MHIEMSTDCRLSGLDVTMQLYFQRFIELCNIGQYFQTKLADYSFQFSCNFIRPDCSVKAVHFSLSLFDESE